MAWNPGIPTATMPVVVDGLPNLLAYPPLEFSLSLVSPPEHVGNDEITYLSGGHPVIPGSLDEILFWNAENVAVVGNDDVGRLLMPLLPVVRGTFLN